MNQSREEGTGQEPTKGGMGRWLPFGIFVVLVGFLGVGLTLDPREVPSPFIGKQAPHFALQRLHDPSQQITVESMRGKVWLLNVWASWCGSCRAEHAVITRFAKTGMVDIVGLNYKDKPGQAREWLAQLGDPYLASGMDSDGRVGIDWGVYGVPETFVIDQQGVVQFKHIGPVTETSLKEKLIPLIQRLQGGGA